MLSGVAAAGLDVPLVGQPEQRIVVELKFFQEMTFEQIALVVEAPLSTVKSRLYHGLEILKIRLARGVV